MYELRSTNYRERNTVYNSWLATSYQLRSFSCHFHEPSHNDNHNLHLDLELHLDSDVDLDLDLEFHSRIHFPTSFHGRWMLCFHRRGLAIIHFDSIQCAKLYLF